MANILLVEQLRLWRQYLMHPNKVVEKTGLSVMYLPALLDRRMKIWDPEWKYYYPGLLRSVANEELLPKTARDNCFIFVDSGGYSLVSGGIGVEDITTSYVCEVANRLGDAVASLDFPPVDLSVTYDKLEKIFVPEPEYSRRLEFSAKNAVQMRGTLNSDVLLYTVVHGNTWNRIREWYKKSDPNEESVALALAPKPPSSVDQVMMHLCLAAERKVKYVHLFALSVQRVMLVCEYARRHSDLEFITYDSTVFASGTKFRSYMSPINGKPEIQYSRDPQFVKRPCNCQACMAHDWSKQLDPETMDLHNLYQMSKYDRYLEALSDSYLEEVIRGAIGNLHTDFMIDAFDLGYENAKLKDTSLLRWVQ